MGSHELVCQRAFSWSFSASPSSKEALSEIWPMDYWPFASKYASKSHKSRIILLENSSQFLKRSLDVGGLYGVCMRLICPV